jgi:hypothetical protein
VANITARNTGQQATGLGITQGNDEPVDTVVLAMDDCLANSD